ncbi:MAG TPA: choice-of-anchor D domain-containing protein, partial [Bacteroidota bacterium]|nr:choice-of-anchor D domain-containing protein [Bacteroidota bacterium]
GFSLNTKFIAFGNVPTGTSKKDSVVITNAGTTSLTVSAVTSTNGAFTVSPSAATIGAAGTAKFYVTFTPANTTAQSGFVRFTHTGSSSPDTVAVSGTGTTPGFSVSAKFIAFGTVALGSSKQDSVTVTSTGSAALVISGVTSGNSAFAVSPGSATLQPGESRKFYFTFTPSVATLQYAQITFLHNAPPGRDTVTVSGAGGTVGFVLNRRTVDFGSVALGNTKSDSVTVTDTGTAALVITSVSSGNPRFTVSPTSATVSSLQSRTFRISFTPLTATPQSGIIVFSHNAQSHRDTVTVGGAGVAPPPPPSLAAPANGAGDQGAAVSLSWNAVNGAALYRVELATDSLFRSIILSDSAIQLTSRAVSGLPPNTLCYWHVATGNLAGFGQSSAPWHFSTVATGAVAGTITFTGDVSSTSYRMFGLPGIGTRTAGSLLQGTQKMDWRLLRDNGKDTTYPAYYEDMTAGSTINTGEGYWLLQKSSLVIARTDSLPPLGPDGTYPIPLHGGWNMISDPFTVSVGRDAVIAANGLPAGTAFWEHIGAVRTSTGGTTLDPFKGYYFDNSTANLAVLKIPYPFSSSVSKRAPKAPAVDWQVELVFSGEINTDRDNYAGIAPSAGDGPNAMDGHEAPLVFDEGFLYFNRPAWDPARSRFASDMRPALGEGQKWDFEVWNPRMGRGTITVNGVSTVPAQYRVALVDPLNSTPVDLRQENTYAYATTSRTMQFTLIVGTQAYVDGEVAQLVPRSFALEQNYPNPFNPSTTITYLLPAPADVRLEILTVLGQRVRALESGYRPAAAHTVVWDGRDDRGQAVSSGVYFCRLTAGGNMVRTRKLLLVK